VGGTCCSDAAVAGGEGEEGVNCEGCVFVVGGDFFCDLEWYGLAC